MKKLTKSTVTKVTPARAGAKKARAGKKTAFDLKTVTNIFINGARAVDTVATEMFSGAIYGFGRAGESFEKSLKSELKERLGKEGYTRFKPQATRCLKAAGWVCNKYKSEIRRIVENAESDEVGIEKIKEFLNKNSIKNYKAYELYKKEKNAGAGACEKGAITIPPESAAGRAGDSGDRYLDSAIAVVETAESITDVIAAINAIVTRALDYFYTAEDLEKLHKVLESNSIKLSKSYQHPKKIAS